MVELSNGKKKQIESLPTEEMIHEINLGRRSRFQREKFAYLQTCYQKRIEEAKLINNPVNQNNNSNHTKDIVNKTQQAKEPKLVLFAWSVAVIIFASITLWVINHYFNLGLF